MQQLHKIESWLQANLPEVASDLQPGAAQNELQHFVTSLGINVPDEFLCLYAWHNGQEMKVISGPWYGLNFLPLHRVLQECLMWRQVLQESSEESLRKLSSQMSSTPDGFVKMEYANEKWIPFAYDGAGNYLGVDLDPDERGAYGQVINFGRDEERKIAISPSIGSFLTWFLDELLSGNVNIKEESDGGRSFNTLRPEKYHFLDSVALIFPK
ncbi:MAG: beta-1 3-glucan biosynthesis protein [Sphingobacteriales bacterium]|nr:MAG: beta-1 3-glucan biosynthesis protein [Sphingobacteriales bacterium]